MPIVSSRKMNIFIIILLSLFVGLSASLNPILLVVPIAMIVFYPLFKYSIVRILYVLIGGILVFQSSDGVGSLKMIFLLSLIVVTGISVLSTKIFEDKTKIKEEALIYNLIVSCFLLGGYLILNTLISILFKNSSIIAAIQGHFIVFIICYDSFVSIRCCEKQSYNH